jgi:uncharacterized protein
MNVSILALLICTTFAASARAEPLAEADDALRKRDVAGALRILEQAAAGGNVAAKGRLASYLRTLPPPHRNWERACALAREASAAGDAIGSITRAECLVTGAEKAEQPFVLARDLARNTLKSGVPTAGFTLYMAYSLDPKYRYYGPDGKPDSAKYNALAALPIAARGEQIEALDGLAQAMSAGQVNAALVAISYLSDSSAPGNIDRLVGLAAILSKHGVQLTEQLAATVRVAQEIQRFGNTHASVSAFRNAYTSALTGAVFQIRGLDEKTPCDIKEVKLTQVAAEPVSNAGYLPISKAPLVHTYLMSGSWIESWTFTGCQQTVALRMEFSADGWSGAHFKTTYRPKVK